MANGTPMGVSTLPALPGGWSYAVLEDLLEPAGISYGIVQPGTEVPDGIPIVRVKDLKGGRVIQDDPLRVSSDIEEKYTRTRLKGGEVLLSLVGSVGETAVASSELKGWNVARAIGVLRVSGQISAQWLKICLSADVAQQYMHSRLNTTVQATLNLRDLRKVPIVMPPESDRRAIGAVLGALDDKIDVNERIAAAAMSLAAALFRRAAQTAQRESILEDLIDLKYGKALPGANRKSGSVPVIGSGGVSGWHNESLIGGPGVIVGRKGSVGTIYWSQQDFFPIDTTFYVSLKPSELSMEYVYFALQDLGLQHMNSDSAVPGLNRANALAATLRVPGAREISRFTSSAKELFKLKYQHEKESISLAALRDTLLPQLMSGKLRVRDAERIVEDVV